MVLFLKRASVISWRLGLSSLIAIQVGFIVYIAGFYLFSVSDAAIVDMDFYQDYFAATQLAHNQNIYQHYPASFPSLLPATNPLLTTGCFHHSAHPPFTALLFFPMTGIPIRIVLGGWLVLNMLWLGAAFFMIKQELFPTLTRKSILVFLVILLLSYSFMENIWTEQLTILLFFLIVLGWRSARRGQQTRAGIYLALAALIHLTPALLLVYLAWKRQWRAVITFACTAGIVLVGTLKWLPLDVYWRYFTQISPQDVSCWASHFDNKSLLGFFSRLFPAAQSDLYYLPPSQLATMLTLFVSGGLLLLCLWLFRRQATNTSDSTNLTVFDNEWGLVMLAMLLISPLTWSHSLLMLCLPLLLLIKWIREETGAVRRILQRLFALSVLLLFITPNMFNVSPILLPLEDALQAIVAPTHPAPLWQILTIYAAGLCGMLVLFGIFVWYRATRFPRLLAEPTQPHVVDAYASRSFGPFGRR